MTVNLSRALAVADYWSPTFPWSNHSLSYLIPLPLSSNPQHLFNLISRCWPCLPLAGKNGNSQKTIPHTPTTALTYLPASGLLFRPPTNQHRWKCPCSYPKRILNIGTPLNHLPHQSPLTCRRTSLQQFSSSLLIIRFSVYWIVPNNIQTSCDFSFLKVFCSSQDMAQCHSNTSGSVEGNVCLTLERRCLYLLFQLLFSHPLLNPFYCSFHPTTALNLFCQDAHRFPLGLAAFDTVTPSSLMYILQLLLEHASTLFWISPLSFVLSLFFLFFLFSLPSWCRSAPGFGLQSSSLLYLYIPFLSDLSLKFLASFLVPQFILVGESEISWLYFEKYIQNNHP